MKPVIEFNLDAYNLDIDKFLANRMSHLSVKKVADAWSLYEDDVSEGPAFETGEKALAWGYNYIATKKAEFSDKIRTVTQLDFSFWEVGSGSTSIVFKHDPSRFIIPRSLNWEAFVSGISVGVFSTATEAASTLSRFLTVNQMALLEDAYIEAKGIEYLPGCDDTAVLLDRQLLSKITLDGEDVCLLTEEGREALDSDPRNLPLDLRDIIFAGAAHVGYEGSARRDWTTFLSCDYSFNAKELLWALENELDLSVGTAQNDPREITVVASGTSKDGAYCSDLNVALFAPEWDKDWLVSQKLAEAIVAQRDDLVAAAQLRKSSNLTSSPAPSP